MEPEFTYLANFLKSHHPFTNSELKLIFTKLSLLVLNPTEFFIQAGQTVDQVGFIVEGILCATYSNTQICNEIPYFMPAGHFVSEVHGLYFSQPASMNIRAIVPTKILVIDLSQLEELKQHIPTIDKTIDKINIQELAFVTLMLSFPRRMNAEDKLIEFRRNFPDLAKALPDKYIATFLGISHTYFSNIKNKLVRKK